MKLEESFEGGLGLDDSADIQGEGIHEKEAEQDAKDVKDTLEWAREMWGFLKDTEYKIHGGKKTSGYFFALENELKKKDQIKKMEKPGSQNLEDDPKTAQERKDLSDYKKSREPGPNQMPYVTFFQPLAPANTGVDEKYATYKVDFLHRMELKKNQDNITRLYNLLESKNHWYRGSSENFKSVSRNLKRMKNLSVQLTKLYADKGELNQQLSEERKKKIRETLDAYEACAQEVKKAADHYLENKKGNINSDYARARFDIISEISSIASVNYKTIRDAYKQEAANQKENRIMEEEKQKRKAEKLAVIENWKKNIFPKYEISNSNENGAVYYTKRNEKDLSPEDIHSNFSVNRTAPLSVAVLGMMAEKDKDKKPKYSIDDIMDATKLKDEKKAMYQKVLRAMQKGDKGDPAWLGEIMHNGFEMALTHIDTLLKRVDFKNPDFVYDENFTKAMEIGSRLHDAWQEMSREPKQIEKILELANEGQKRFENINDYLFQRETQSAVISGMSTAVQNIAKHVLNKGDSLDDVGIQVTVLNSFALNGMKKMMVEKAGQKKGVAFKDWFEDRDSMTARDLIISGRHMVDTSDFEKAGFEDHLNEILDGSIYQSFSYKFNEERKNLDWEGQPIDFTLLNKETAYKKLSHEEMMRRLDNQLSYYEELKKTSDPQMQSYLNKASKGIVTLAKLSFDAKITPEKQKMAKEAMKEVFSYYVAKEMKNIGLDEEELQQAVEANVEKLKVYQKYAVNLGRGAIAGMVMTDFTEEVAEDRELGLFKGNAAWTNLAQGAYADKSLETTMVAFSYALTSAMYEHVGTLPYDWYNPGRRYTPAQFAEEYLNLNAGNKEFREEMLKLQKDPEKVVQLLQNKEGLKKYMQAMNTGRAEYLEKQEMPKMDYSGFQHLAPATEKKQGGKIL